MSRFRFALECKRVEDDSRISTIDSNGNFFCHECHQCKPKDRTHKRNWNRKSNCRQDPRVSSKIVGL